MLTFKSYEIKSVISEAKVTSQVDLSCQLILFYVVSSILLNRCRFRHALRFILTLEH